MTTAPEGQATEASKPLTEASMCAVPVDTVSRMIEIAARHGYDELVIELTELLYEE